MEEGFIYKKSYVIKDLKENAYVSYFSWRGNEYTNLIYKAEKFETKEEALKQSKYGEIDFIEIVTIHENVSKEDEDN